MRAGRYLPGPQFLICFIITSTSLPLRFTIVTATYNRAHTLGRVYGSLLAQTFRDFEWVVVDDGSSDGTRELVGSWKASFPIRYFWKPNGGQHTAMNLGLSVAEGEFLEFVDSDDAFVPHALERFDYHWRQIPDPSRFYNVLTLCCRPDGSIVGKPFAADRVDTFTLADTLRHLGPGDRCGMNRTAALREFFPYPEGEPWCPLGLMWNRLAQRYATRFVNEPLLIVYSSPDSNTRRDSALRASSPKATLTYYWEAALAPAPPMIRLRAAINYCRFAVIAAVRRLRKRS